MKLFLVRHAQSQNNARPIIERVQDAPITELGVAQAERLAEWARHAELDQLWTSPFLRALQTSQPMHDVTDAPWETWTELHEQGGCVSGVDLATFQGQPGMTDLEIAQAFPGCRVSADIDAQGWWKCRPRETTEALVERVARVRDRLLGEFGSTSVRMACVTHADFSDLLISALLGEPIEPSEPLRGLFNTGITSFTIDGETVRMDRYNCVDHLEPTQVT